MPQADGVSKAYANALGGFDSPNDQASPVFQALAATDAFT